MLSNQEALAVFLDSGALMEGHFKLTSGRHSNQYMQCAQLLKYPDMTEKVVSNLTEQFKR
jgi:orotate phosphoribosyltransferase